MKTILISCAFLLINLAFSIPVNEANRIIDFQQRQLEQERIRQEQEKIQKEFENTRFDNSQIKIDDSVKNIDMDPKKFLIYRIDLKDKDKLLTKKEKSKILGQYEYMEIGSDDIQKLMSEITNNTNT